VAGTGPGDLYELCEELLDFCAEALDTIPDFPDPAWLADMDGAPSNRFVSPGPPLRECCDDGQLTVHVQPITDRLHRSNANPGSEKVNLPTLIVTLLRCVSIVTEEGEVETPAVQTEFAKQHMADGWALWNHIYNLIRAEQFLTLCQAADFVAMVPVPVEGMCGGWQLNFQVELEGYAEVLAT